MRISSEGQATDTAATEEGNRLKLLKKLSFKILQKAVDREVNRCRMRPLETSSKPVDFRRFPETENIENKRLTRRRHDVEYATLIEQQLKRSLKN